MEYLIAEEADRRSLRRERRFSPRLDPLSVSDEELQRHYRFPRRELVELIDELSSKENDGGACHPCTHTSFGDTKVYRK